MNFQISHSRILITTFILVRIFLLWKAKLSGMATLLLQVGLVPLWNRPILNTKNCSILTKRLLELKNLKVPHKRNLQMLQFFKKCVYVGVGHISTTKGRCRIFSTLALFLLLTLCTVLLQHLLLA